MITKRGAGVLGVASMVLFATAALADTCSPVVSSSCAGSSACTVLNGSYTNTTGKKVKQAEIVALSADDNKTLAAALVVFTGTTVTVYDPTSNTPPSGLNSGDTASYTISVPFPLAAMDGGLTCVVQQIW
jgi:hypothetical protein